MVKPDVFFVSYDEPDAANNWLRLLDFAPDAIPVDGIAGIHAAHRACAERATTDHFIVVDADNWVLDGDPFVARDYDPHAVYVWRAVNAVNGLVYGNGAIKALPRSYTANVSTSSVDMTSAISYDYRIIHVLASEHRFNTSRYDAWRTAFRECVKLSSRILPNHVDKDTQERLDVWCSAEHSTGDYWSACLAGARAGRKYGTEHRENPEALRRINDFEWLRTFYTEGS